MFIMNFKEIHSNTEFLSTYRRAGACSCRKYFKLQFEKWLELNVQAIFGAFRLLLGGQYQRTAPTRKIRNLSHFLEVSQRVEIYNWVFLHAE